MLEDLFNKEFPGMTGKKKSIEVREVFFFTDGKEIPQRKCLGLS